VERLEYPKDRIRIVFVDNRSENKTPQILEKIKKHSGSTYEGIMIISEKSNIPEALNICISNPISKCLFFIVTLKILKTT